MPTLDADLEAVPAGGAVFLLYAEQGEPYIARTNVLRRRLKRLLGSSSSGRVVRYREVAKRVEFWPVASRLESTLVFYDVARQHFPSRYGKLLKLSPPSFLRLTTGNTFPRLQHTNRLGGLGDFIGPFRTRTSAELYEHEVLSLFQLRRCPEDLDPHPEHPGCVYGEMNMCLRPCQQVVSADEYRSEAERVLRFFVDEGRSLLQAAEAARERSSRDLEFEEALRQHRRADAIRETLKLRDDLAGPLGQLNGVAITASREPSAVNLWFVKQGSWQSPRLFSVAKSHDTVSMDKRLKELAATVYREATVAESVQEHIAILAKWYYSTWRDGEWLRFDDLHALSYRKLVAAISRQAKPA